MRTTIRMNEELARRAKNYAAQTSRSFTQLIEDAVTAFVTHPPDVKSRRKRITFPVSGESKNRITEAKYRAMIDQMYEDEAKLILKGERGSS